MSLLVGAVSGLVMVIVSTWYGVGFCVSWGIYDVLSCVKVIC